MAVSGSPGKRQAQISLRIQAPFPDVVVHGPGKWRIETGLAVPAADGVLVPGSDDGADPVFAQEARSQVVHAVVLQEGEPCKLQIQIVVGLGFSVQVFLNIEGDVLKFLLSFERGAEGAADIFAEPAAADGVEHFPGIDLKLLSHRSGTSIELDAERIL